MDKNLLDILVCPVSKAPLHYDAQAQELICKTSNLAYPIRDGIPIMLEEEARALSEPRSPNPDTPPHAS
ncbi:MAG: Trm112 family protein [Gammaproteobacteria bacterium]